MFNLPKFFVKKRTTPMSSSEYMRRKNKIVKRATGITLVPEDQIVDVKFVPLKVYSLTLLHSGICPYCPIYADYDPSLEACKYCPMNKAGNRCSTVRDSGGYVPNNTWEKANNAWQIKAKEEDREQLAKLIGEYNESNKRKE